MLNKKGKITAIFISLLLAFEQTMLPIFAQDPVAVGPETSIPAVAISQVVPDESDLTPSNDFFSSHTLSAVTESSTDPSVSFKFLRAEKLAEVKNHIAQSGIELDEARKNVRMSEKEFRRQWNTFEAELRKKVREVQKFATQLMNILKKTMDLTDVVRGRIGDHIAKIKNYLSRKNPEGLKADYKQYKAQEKIMAYGMEGAEKNGLREYKSELHRQKKQIKRTKNREALNAIEDPLLQDALDLFVPEVLVAQAGEGPPSPIVKLEELLDFDPFAEEPQGDFTNSKSVVTPISDTPTGNVDIQFSALTEAVLYQVQIAKDENFQEIIYEGFPSTAIESAVLSENGTYWVRVRGSMNQSVEVGPVSLWSDAVSFDVDLFSKRVTGLTGPEFTSEETFELTWQPIEGAIIYEVQELDSNGNILRTFWPSGTAESVTLPASGNYSYQVRAWSGLPENGGIASQFSNRHTVLYEILAPARMISPYENTETPANVLYWNLNQMNDSAGGFSHMDIYRRDPGSSEYHSVGRMNHLSNRYVDYDIQTDHLPYLSYDYEIRITRADGTIYSFTPDTVNKVNYGPRDLQAENVLVIASSSSEAGGRGEAILGNGTDLVDYYMNRRNIPSQNLIRLNIHELTPEEISARPPGLRGYLLEDFKNKILIPIYNYLVANNLQNKIWAFTTMPGVHGTVGDTPIETLIASLLPLLFQDQNVNSANIAAYLSADVDPDPNINKSWLSAHFGKVENPNAQTSNTDYLLKTTLGYTRLDAPETVIDGVTLTAQENLKRLIDQTLQAEEQARVNREAGITPDYYVHLFDQDGPGGAYGSEGNYGDSLIQSMANLLSAYGYTTYVEGTTTLLSGIPQDLLNALTGAGGNSPTKLLMGIAGGYWVSAGRYGIVYEFIKNIGGFGLGSYVTPLDSGSASGWEALKRDGVVMAVNVQHEPVIDGTAMIASAFLYTGTPLAFASALASKYVRWRANVFGDPLYNIGKFIAGGAKNIFDALGNLLGTREVIEAGKINDSANTLIDVFRNMDGKVAESQVGSRRETYLADGGMTIKSTYSEDTYDALGRMVRQKVSWKGSAGQDIVVEREFIYDASGIYQGFITHHSDGSQAEFDSFNRRLTRDSSGIVIRADQFYPGGSVWPIGQVHRREYFEGNGYPSHVVYVEDIRYFSNIEIIRKRYFEYTSDGKISGIRTENIEENNQTIAVSRIAFDQPLDHPWKQGTASVTYADGDSETLDFNNLFDLFDDIYAEELPGRGLIMLMIRASIQQEISKRQGLPLDYQEEFDLNHDGYMSAADISMLSSLPRQPQDRFLMAKDKLMRAANKPNFAAVFDIDAFEDDDGDSKVDGDGVIDQKDLDVLEDFLWFGRTDRPV